MGQTDVSAAFDPQQLRLFGQKVLRDLRALEAMIEQSLFETDRRRIGAEQEMCLVTPEGFPALVGPAILEAVEDSHLTTELGRFNLELNLDPQEFEGHALSVMEGQLLELLAIVRRGAREEGSEVLLTGLLPTLEKRHLTLEAMTPVPRYHALNEAMRRLRDGEDFQFHIRGEDELRVSHDNVMLEACTTSFQVHYQVAPAEFALAYNTAQLLAAPVLAVATNSPLLFGHRLWRETRIAVFEQSIDTRPTASHHRQQARRVSFGREWVKESVLELFRDDISRFPAVLAVETDEDSLALLEKGEIPKLRALQLRNGTVYRWNRPCYGITDGKPHLRIENRLLPSGPSVRDEMANAALWLGLMSGLPAQLGDPSSLLPFDEARSNFIAAARHGLDAQVSWPGLGRLPVAVLLEETLLPIARQGLEEAGVARDDVDEYLWVIAGRVRSGRTGSRWILEAAGGERGMAKASALAHVVRETLARQAEGLPVHEWSPAQPPAEVATPGPDLTVSHLMTGDLFTVGEEEVVDVVAAVMNWRHLRRIPVEDAAGRLVGLVTYRALLRVLSDSQARRALPVGEIMTRDLHTASPDTTVLEALKTMQEHRVGCLPIVDGDRRLVGILTEHDLIGLARPLLERHLTGDEGGPTDRAE